MYFVINSSKFMYGEAINAIIVFLLVLGEPACSRRPSKRARAAAEWGRCGGGGWWQGRCYGGSAETLA